MKIVGFSQLRNEHRKGNLENWIRCMDICDYVYLVDQASDDGSQEIYKHHDKLHVTYNTHNDFINELGHKASLLEKVLIDHPDTDWILWVDGDTLIDGRLLAGGKDKLEELCSKGDEESADALTFGHYNLSRSDVHYRTDNEYHGIHISGVVSLWRNNKQLHFPRHSGLHLPQRPVGIDKLMRTDINLVHRGFSTDYQIMLKYDVYRDRGQSGWALDRLLDESTLQVEQMPVEYLPEWFETVDIVNPTTKTPLREIYSSTVK